MSIGLVVAVVLATACAGGLTQTLLVPRLPEPVAPDPATDAWTKPAYRALGGPVAVALAAVGGAVVGLAAGRLSGWQVAAVLLPAGPLASLTVVDARTTYLPRPLDRLCWVLGLAGCAVSAVSAPSPMPVVGRWLAAAASTALFFWLVWRVSGSLGWGDVRLAPLLALAPATVSWTLWFHYLLLGTLAGAAWGVATQLWRRHRPHPLGQVFPYAPGLWVGYAAALLIG